MPNQSVSPNLETIWTPEDYQRTVADAIAAEQAEFDADLAYIRGLSNAILEHGSPGALAQIAARDGIK